MSFPFVKMHGLGNDYVYVDALSRPAMALRKDLPNLARRVSNRHTGVGSDGLILICPPTDAAARGGAHARMRMFNADGSESQMCGNGIRCVAKFMHDRLGIRPSLMLIETGRGTLSITYRVDAEKLVEATVDMGEPILGLGPEQLDPFQLAQPVAAGRGTSHDRERAIEVLGRRLVAIFVSMGNPHAVFFAGAQAGPLDLAILGPAIEHHAAFPQRINAHAVQVLSPRHARLTTWERGAGLTQACGTGACAVLVAGVLTGRLQRRATLDLPGGALSVEWSESTGHVLMTGPACEVFEGTWPE